MFINNILTHYLFKAILNTASVGTHDDIENKFYQNDSAAKAKPAWRPLIESINSIIWMWTGLDGTDMVAMMSTSWVVETDSGDIFTKLIPHMCTLTVGSLRLHHHSFSKSLSKMTQFLIQVRYEYELSGGGEGTWDTMGLQSGML